MKYISKILILFILCSSSSVEGQVITNMSRIHNKIGSTTGGVDDESICYAECENYNYLAFKANAGDFYFNDSLVLNDNNKSNDIRVNKFNILQLTKDNKFNNKLEISIKINTSTTGGINAASFNIPNIYGYEDKLFVYGSMYKTDSFFINGNYYRKMNKTGAFVLTFDDNLNLIDELFFQDKNSDIHIWLKEVMIHEDKMILFGSFIGKYPGSTYFMDIGQDSVSSINLGSDNLTEFILTWNIENRTLDKHITFTHQSIGFFSLKDIDIDQQGNVYVASDNYGGGFNVLGHTAQYERHFDYDGVTFSLDKDDNLNYFMHYEGYGYEAVNMINACELDYVYEVGWDRYDNFGDESLYMYMNNDSILIDKKHNQLVVKRRKNGELQWINYSGCSLGLDYWLTMDCSHEDHIVLGGSFGCLENYDRQGAIRYIDKKSGQIIKDYAMVKDTLTRGFSVNAIKYQADGKLKVISAIGGINKIDGPFTFSIAGETITLPEDNIVLIFDFDEKAVSTREEYNESMLLYPNPIQPGEVLKISGLGSGVELTICDVLGRQVAQIQNGGTVPNIDNGVYVIVDKSQRYCGKMMVVGN